MLLEEEVARLTGQTDKNQLQDKLRLMEIPFAVNAAGMPLVPFEAVTGNAEHAATAAAVLSKRLKAMYALIGVKIENY